QAETQSREVQKAARAIGQQVLILSASTEQEIETAFAAFLRERAGALLVGADTFFTSQPAMFVVLTARHAIPAIYPWRSHVDAVGGYPARSVPAGRGIRRPGAQGRDPGRPADPSVDQIRAGDQSQDC